HYTRYSRFLIDDVTYTSNIVLDLKYIFFFYSYRDHRDLHSFPTRRSSDLNELNGRSAWPSGFSRRTFDVEEMKPNGVDSEGNQRSEEHTSELQSRGHLVCRLLLEKKKNRNNALDEAL